MTFRRTRRGFSLVELLAVVLILAVLAAVAVPLYMNTRASAALRSCKANVAAIAAAESAYALRKGTYGTITELKASPEGLAETPVCPDAAGAYTLAPADGATKLELTISCAVHAAATKKMAPITIDPLS